jgi:hypothetical protein
LAGAVVLGSAAAMLAVRSGLPWLPAIFAGGACALGCVVVAGFAMAASLVLPRAATLMLVLGGVWLIALANGLGAVTPVAGWLGALDRTGPPLASAMAMALAPWLEGATFVGEPVQLFARLAAWAIGAVVVLMYGFRRVEVRG